MTDATPPPHDLELLAALLDPTATVGEAARYVGVPVPGAPTSRPPEKLLHADSREYAADAVSSVPSGKTLDS